VSGDANVRAFGSVIRAIVPDGTTNPSGSGEWVAGVQTYDNAQFHLHGGIISLNVSPLTSNVGVSALEASDNSKIHTPDTAFVLKPAGTGQVYRTYTYTSTATIESPYNWPPANNPPPIVSDPLSSDGADMFVETDCDDSGNCDTAPVAEQEPHLMVYTAKCSFTGPWFDIVRAKCRGKPDDPEPPIVLIFYTEPPAEPTVSYIEKDCPFTATEPCSAGKNELAKDQYPRLMLYREDCIEIEADQGPWFDTVEHKCRN
jgi:hypothetical protein